MYGSYKNDDALMTWEFNTTKSSKQSRIEDRSFSKDTKYVNRGQRVVYRKGSNETSKSTRYNIELSDYAHALCVSNNFLKEQKKRREKSKSNSITRNRSRLNKYCSA
jgi:hypothetical protein